MKTWRQDPSVDEGMEVAVFYVDFKRSTIPEGVLDAFTQSDCCAWIHGLRIDASGPVFDRNLWIQALACLSLGSGSGSQACVNRGLIVRLIKAIAGNGQARQKNLPTCPLNVLASHL